MKTILCFQSSLNASNNSVLDGVVRYAKSANWKVRVTPYADAAYFRYADNPQKTWRRLFREDWHDIFVKTVKGIPFIGAQWKSEQAPFVKPPVAETVAKLAPTFDPKQPFFFFQHNPPDCTCHARRGGKVLREALSPYSNAVAITGHTHDSISDDRSVWQGSFTSIGAGCMHEASGGLDFRNVNYFWHKPSRTKPMRTTEWIARGGCCNVVEVFADHLVSHRRSVQRTEAIGEDWAVPLPAAYGKDFDFKVREKEMIAPQFDPGAKVKVVFCPTGHPEQSKRSAGQPCVAVDFPSARTPRGVVSAYEVAARHKDGPEIVRTKVIPNGFGLDRARMTIPGTCLFRLGGTEVRRGREEPDGSCPGGQGEGRAQEVRPRQPDGPRGGVDAVEHRGGLRAGRDARLPALPALCAWSIPFGEAEPARAR